MLWPSKLCSVGDSHRILLSHLHRPSVSKTPPPTVKVVPPEEPKRAPANPNWPYVEVLRPPVHILKRPDPVMAGLMPMDMDPRASSHEKRKESKISKTKSILALSRPSWIPMTSGSRIWLGNLLLKRNLAQLISLPRSFSSKLRMRSYLRSSWSAWSLHSLRSNYWINVWA